jgi:predicted transposase YbfD/YdcC
MTVKELRVSAKGRWYYLLSTAMTAERFSAVVRSLQATEKRLNWRLDVIMNEDQDRNRTDNSPYFAIPRHMAQNVMRKEGSKGARRGKLKRATWNNAYLRR